MPTASTLPLLILVVFLWKLTKGNVLAIVLFTSIFDAASALNFGSVGIAPWVACLLGCIVIKFICGHRPLIFPRTVNRGAIVLLGIFVTYSAASSIINPNLFHGMLVLRYATVEGLAWGPTNFAQLCYLLAVGAVFLLAATRSPEEMESAIQWYVRGCVVAGFFAIYQLANAVFHVPYPNDVLYSNPSHMIFPAYPMNGFWRLNSTFPEASEMAGFMALGLGFAGWDLVSRRITMVNVAKVSLLAFSLIVTFSTTGYLTLVVIVVAGLAIYVYQVSRRGTIAPGQLIFGIIVFGACVSIGATPRVRATIMDVVQYTVLGKADSDSYKARTETHATSLETARKTYLLGAGWGSIRPSGLFYVLIANVGLIGCLSFAGAVLSLYFPLTRNVSSPAQIYQRSLFGICIMLTAMLLAGAEPVAPVLWALFGVAAASYVPRAREARLRRSYTRELLESPPLTVSH